MYIYIYIYKLTERIVVLLNAILFVEFSKLPKLPKLPECLDSGHLFRQLLKFPKIPITRACDLTFLYPFCPRYLEYPNYQLPGVLFFANYSNSLKYQLPGHLILTLSNLCVQVT